jgi:hypothetical protein
MTVRCAWHRRQLARPQCVGRRIGKLSEEKGAGTLSAGVHELLRSGRARAHLVNERRARAPDDQCPTRDESQTLWLGFIVNNQDFSSRRSLYKARQQCDAGGKPSRT